MVFVPFSNYLLFCFAVRLYEIPKLITVKSVYFTLMLYHYTVYKNLMPYFKYRQAKSPNKLNIHRLSTLRFVTFLKLFVAFILYEINIKYCMNLKV